MLEHHTITHPAVPDRLDGFTVMHLTDLHARWPIGSGRHRWWSGLGSAGAREALGAVEVDLVALTGDYHDRPGQEEHGIELLREMSRCWRARYGAVGVFGNHDTPRFRRLAAAVEGVRWIGGVALRVGSREPGGRGPIGVGGMGWPEDVAGVMGAAREAGFHGPPLLMLAHVPTALVACAGFGVPIVLCGHTHGGQVRPWRGWSPHTSSDTPRTMAAGLLRDRDTLCAVSRGVGDGVVERLRINCPRQVCVYTLRRGAWSAWREGDGPRCQEAW